MQAHFRFSGIAVATLSIVLLTSTNVSAAEVDAEGSTQKAVLVTGASSGIGRKITEVFAAEGYFVYAGARKPQDLAALNKIPNVQSIRLDVTVQEEIDAAVKTVTAGGRGLYGLVNNAGVGGGGPLIETDEADVRWLFDVNVFGVFKVTQAFAPLIIEGNGRIVNIGSIAGVLTSTGLGPYSMSKHAIEAYSDALFAEMQRFDVHVAVVEPGNYKSEITKTARARRGELTDAQKRSPYAEYYQRSAEGPADRSQHKEPDEVAMAVKHAMFADAPRPRYMVVPERREAGWTIGAAMRKLVQMNEKQPHAFSREELIEMLDQQLGINQN